MSLETLGGLRAAFGSSAGERTAMAIGVSFRETTKQLWKEHRDD